MPAKSWAFAADCLYCSLQLLVNIPTVQTCNNRKYDTITPCLENVTISTGSERHSYES